MMFASLHKPHPSTPNFNHPKRCFLNDVNEKHYVVHSFKIDRLSGQIYIPSWFVYGGPPVPPSKYPPIPMGRDVI